jgi:hypothetical protein
MGPGIRTVRSSGEARARVLPLAGPLGTYEVESAALVAHLATTSTTLHRRLIGIVIAHANHAQRPVAEVDRLASTPIRYSAA